MRRRTRCTTVLCAFLVLTALASACTDTRAALGAECLKDADCVSGFCAQLRCASGLRTIDRAFTAPSTDGAFMAPSADGAFTAPSADAAGSPSTQDALAGASLPDVVEGSSEENVE